MINKLNSKKIISYNEFKPSIILFNNIPKFEGYKDINACSIISTYQSNNKEYIELNKFYKEYLNLGTLLNLSDYGGPQFKFELYNICLTPDKKKIDIAPKLENYEFTIDNFVKMVLIYLRIRAKVPLILLGETGCGKTSLIETLALFLSGKYRLLTFNIHSGLYFEDIYSFLDMNHLIDKKYYSDELKKLLEPEKKEEKKEEENIILFLDEINTTKSINLLSDIFTKHCFMGHRLKSNVFIIAACNPYRLMLSKNEDIGYINKKVHHVRNLVYTVNPLPLCLINYIFDFGNLRDEDENKYIHKFVDSFLNTRFSKSNNENYTNILNIICSAVYTCQKFIRENSEISAVSLREIKRFRIFFEFFINITKNRKEFKTSNFLFVKDNSIFKEALTLEEKKENIIILKSANLSLFMCYYIRIINSKKREELAKKIDEILKFDFMEYPLKLENELADNIILDKGIAKNRALLDNLFSIFVCLNNKIPVFICGKAGCSKSLSFSLLYQSMKGEYSKNNLFQKYPSLYVTSYQGSLTSNSYEIKTIFERAKNIAKLENKKIEENKNKAKKRKTKEKKGNLSVIFFDEMGLAEISPYNPLKVLHSELDGKQEVAFVGISNWTLDASKMNRGIHLTVQEPNLDDLIFTATTIANGIYEEIQNSDPLKNIIENLAKSYYSYKDILKKHYGLYYDFHGARDFYNLIKITSRLLKYNIKKQSLESIAMESIERNFGGLELDKEEANIKWPSTKKFKQLFSKYQNNYVENIDKYDIFSCIKNNLEDDNNRYLLLITRKTKNDTLIEFILKKLDKKYTFIQGSKLKEDQNENYVLQKAWYIISTMEKGEIIILKDMEIVYPKFYDLFNQNLQKFGNSQYARIVLDSTTNERHIVNKNFRCIILLEQNEVDNQDPPFLNRFEKHLMSFKYLLNEKQNRIAKELFDEIKDLTTIPDNKKFTPLLVNINLEEIRCLLLDLSYKFDNIENNISEIYKLLIPTFTQENILNSIFSPEKKYIKKEDLIKIYEENSHTNIFKFLEKVENNKIIIYTFSPYYEDIFKQNQSEINNKNFGTISKDNTIEITFNQKLSEKMLNYFFQLYYEKINYNLLVIHFRVKDTIFLKYIKYQLDDFHKKIKEEKRKIFLFIIHIEKNYDIENKNDEDAEKKAVQYLEKYHSYFLSYLSEYQQITIDNLLEQRDISVINLFDKTNEELLIIKELFDVNLIIEKEFSKQITQMAESKQMNSIISNLNNLSKNGILDRIIKNIQNTIKNSDNLLRRILIDYSYLLEKDYDFLSFFVDKIEILISDKVKKLIRELGKNGYLVSCLFDEIIPPKLKEPIFSFINNINLSNVKYDENIENYLLDLKIPGSKILIKNLTNLIKNCKIDYLNKEKEYRKGAKKKDDKIAKKKTLEDVHFEKKQYLKSRQWNDNLLNNDIFSEYCEDIKKDFFTLFFYDLNKKTTINTKQEEFLLFLYSEKNKNIDDLLDGFLYFFLWVGSYHDIFSKLLDIFDRLDKYFRPKEKSINNTPQHEKQSLLDALKENYKIFKMPSEKDKEREIEKEKVNGIFYRISEAFCHIISNVNNVDFDQINLRQFCVDINEVGQILFQFNSTLSLGLKGHFSLITISKIIEYSQKKNMNEDDFKTVLMLFIKNIFDEKTFLLSNQISQAVKAFNEQLDIVINLSNELSMKIIVNKYLQYSRYEKYIYEIVKIVFEFPDLVKYSSLFFNYIFLTETIKPKKQMKREITPEIRNECLNKFGEIKMKKKNKILKEINMQAENNEILKEILIFIFELRIISYFEDYQNIKYIKDNPILLLTEINFDYYLKACTDINNEEFGELNNFGMIFNYSFIRIYLYYFVKYQIQNNNIGDLSRIHNNLINISESELGKMIILYIAKLFILNGQKDYFLKEYLEGEEINNWKSRIINQNKLDCFFPILNFENSKNLLFLTWSKINNDKLNEDEDFINSLQISDLYYIINFSYNEICNKTTEDNFGESIILKKFNEIDKFNFDLDTNNKIKTLFNKISNLDFYEERIKSNLKLVFNMIRLYIIGFAGNKNELLFSLIYSDKINYLIKLFYNKDIKTQKKLIESYYKMKRYLEEEYIKKDNYLPIYICSCGKWYYIKDSLPMEKMDCECGLIIGGKNEVLEERENHFAIYYDEKQKKYIEGGRANKISNNSKLNGKLLKDFKEEFIIEPIFNNNPKLSELLLKNNEINDESFSNVLINFVFLSQIFIEYKIGIMNEDEKINEFNDIDLLNQLINLKNNLENYLNGKKINYDDFMNYFCEYYYEFLKDFDYMKSKEKFYNLFEGLLKNEYKEQTFNNIETNIYTSMTCNPNFKNENLKYLLTATQYPNIELLKKSISLYAKKSLPILEVFVSIDMKNSNIWKLSHIEIINDFINSFSEENSNLITRNSSKSDRIELYLNEIRNRNRSLLDENGNSPLDIQFMKFCDSYSEITNITPSNINRDSLVGYILNDNKIENEKSTINKIYCHLIDIQNEFLNKIIEKYNKYKEKELKDDIIIKNVTEQIQKEIPIQLATKTDIISFDVSNNIILSFEELFSFYSLKNIFNEKDNKIDYSKYSQIKFKLNMIEKDLANIILTGKKIFSKNQITYKFYLDP